MLEESRILDGNDRVSEMRRDSLDWHEIVSLYVPHVLSGCG
jgi:hypothetical protein